MDKPSKTQISDVFSFLNPKELAEMMNCGRIEKIRKDQTVFEEGEKADALYLILKGKIAAIKHSEDREVLVAERGSGSIFGEMGVLEDDNPIRSARVVATEDGEILVIPKTNFVQSVHNGAAWASKFIFFLSKTLSSRLRYISAEYTKIWGETHKENINEMKAFAERLSEKWDF